MEVVMVEAETLSRDGGRKAAQSPRLPPGRSIIVAQKKYHLRYFARARDRFIDNLKCAFTGGDMNLVRSSLAGSSGGNCASGNNTRSGDFTLDIM